MSIWMPALLALAYYRSQRCNRDEEWFFCDWNSKPGFDSLSTSRLYSSFRSSPEDPIMKWSRARPMKYKLRSALVICYRIFGSRLPGTTHLTLLASLWINIWGSLTACHPELPVNPLSSPITLQKADCVTEPRSTAARHTHAPKAFANLAHDVSLDY